MSDDDKKPFHNPFGAIEGATLVLQGDQRKRVPYLLTARGARKVVVG
jgi:translation initiation factor 1 (eIF-1/SUI1)